MALDGRTCPELPENAPQSAPSEPDVIALPAHGGADSESEQRPPCAGRRGDECPAAPAAPAPEFESREDSEIVEIDVDIEKNDKNWNVGRFFRGLVSSGYRVEHEHLYRAWNLILMVPFFLLTLPLLALVALLLLITQGRPIIYKGVRLGRHRKPFGMLKFRTLRQEAATLTRDMPAVPTRSDLKTPLGGFLRETRLDELPQVFNVLRGDMNLLGPRPARPDLARQLEHISGYEARFSVKPGLMGYTQILMSHRTPKRLRTKYTAYLVRHKAYLWKELLILAYMGVSLISHAITTALAPVKFVLASQRLKDRRQVRRARPEGVMVYVFDQQKLVICGSLVDINDESFTLHSDQELKNGEYIFTLSRYPGSKGREKRAICTGTVETRPLKMNGKRYLKGLIGRDEPPLRRYVVHFTPITDFNEYKIDRYFFENTPMP